MPSKAYLKTIVARRNSLADTFTLYFAKLNVMDNSKLVGMGHVVWGHNVYVDGVAYFARVFQVVDGDNVIIKFGSIYNVNTPNHGLERRIKDNLVWLTHVNTTGLADGQSVPKTWDEMELFEVVGTKTYATASGGSNTVKKIAPANLANLGKYEQLFTRLSKARTWFDTSGSLLVEGFVYGYSKGEVEFRRLNGTTERIKMKQLSKDDQKRVREEIKSMRMKRPK